MVQEHWLFKCQLNLLDEINENFLVSGKSVDYYDPISPVQIPVDMVALSQYSGKRILIIW